MVLNEVKSYEITCEPCGRANEKELGDIISRKIKDPRIGFVTVTDVQVSGDLQIAKVYISVLGDEEQKENTLKGLAKAKALFVQKLANVFVFVKHQKLPLSLMSLSDMVIELIHFYMKLIKTVNVKNNG